MNIFFYGKSKYFNVLPNINDAQKMFELILLKIEMKIFLIYDFIFIIHFCILKFSDFYLF